VRLHQLTVTAFGPFGGTVEVDFDALAAGGLFLLTGATGAGKSSVLDAVCFALYGQIPGDRAGAKHLRSDHAPPDREPRVVLELSIGERRFRFTRSPAWSRPKRRGEGITAVPAHVVVEEQRAEGWVGLTNRLDDAGLLVGELLGMSCGQFAQVAMLPQGRFQAFLRASSAERHAVLQQLFRTDRFERVERWLAERRTADRRASEAAADAVRKVLHRVEEAAGVEASAEWADSLALAAEDGRVREWSREIGAAVDVASAEAALAEAEATEANAREALAEARTRESLVRRATAATADLAALATQAEELTEARLLLDRHRKATPLQPLATRLRASQAARSRAEEAAAFSEQDRKKLAAARKKAATALATAEAFLPREHELHQGQRLLGEARERLATVTAELEAAEATLATLPERISVAEARREQSAAAVHRLAGVRAEVARLEELATAAERLTAVTAELAVARDDLRVAIDLAQAAKDRHQEVREARINGMAGELAGKLAAGCGCPVCGSVSHPHPASRDVDAVGHDQESAAESAFVDADFARQNHEMKVAGLESEAAALTLSLAGHDPSALSTVRAEAETLAAAADDAEAAERALASLRTLLTETTAAAEGLRVRTAALEAEIEERDAALIALRAERTKLLADRVIDVEALVAQQAGAIEDLDRALADLDALTLARRGAEEAVAALGEAALAAGFSDAEDAVAALLADPEARRLDDSLAAAQSRRVAAEATLADPEVRAAVEAGSTDLAAIAATHQQAAAAARELASRTAALRKRRERLGVLDAQLADRLVAWTPLRERHRISAELASLADGTSRDNPLKMRLAAYVLAERLRQVVAAANERLSRMTGERYALEHVADRGVGELRGGLSLRVRDNWNGADRDPATLSGGETFVVSLALALGLADTVAHEAGGTDIDTLFIDEGFGSLDAETLEDVMDTLDALRDSGRVVGLVSHVPELRSRITSQLEVVRGLNGPSTLRPVLAGN
jgi:exonuclease SbcC